MSGQGHERRPSAESVGARAPRVAIVSPFAELGGAERWLLQLLDAMADAPLPVGALLLADGPFAHELRERGVPVTTRPTGRRGWQIAAAGGPAVRWLRRQRPEVVLLNGIKAVAALAPYRPLVPAPTLWVKHDHSFDRRLARPLARTVDRVVATSAEVGRATGRADLTVIPPPRPAAPPLSRPAARARLADRGAVAAPPTAVMLTRLVAYKGVDDAIRALRDAPDWELVVLGQADPAEPDEPARLERVAREAGVSARVRFVGWVEDAPALLAAFEAVLVLTRAEGPYGREGFGMAALEAMRAGVPVIASDEGAVAERCRHGGGIVVPARDPAAVAAALRALQDPDRWARESQAGRAATATHPDAATCAHQLATALAATAHGRPPPGRRAGSTPG